MTTFDTRPLTDPVDPAEVARFRTEMTRSGDPRWRPPNPFRSVIMIAVIVVFGSQVVFTWSTMAMGRMGPVGWLPVLAVLVVIAAVGFRAVRGRGGRTWPTHLRLSRFARANGMQYSPRSNPAGFPGLIFGLGHDQRAEQHVYAMAGPVADCGTHFYVTGSGKNRREHRWQYAAIRLESALPHMLLDAKANNGFGSNLPVSFTGDQRLSLGGEFDRHFDLYCPAEYGFDAYYVFTPDLMAHLIDRTHAFDVEVVDNWMFLYTRFELPVTDPATWQRLAAIRDTVARQLRDRSRTYRDRRLAAGPRAAAPPVAGPPAALAGTPAVAAPLTIAPQGRRLRRRFRWSFVVVAVILFAVWLFGVVGMEAIVP